MIERAPRNRATLGILLGIATALALGTILYVAISAAR